MRMPLASLGRGGLVATLVRTAPRMALLVAVVVFLAAFILAGAGLWFGRAADAGLPALLETVPTGQRGLEFERYGWLGRGDASPIEAVTMAGDAIGRGVAPSVANILGQRLDIADTDEYQVPDAPVLTRFVLRVEPGVASGIRFVQGRAPTGQVGTQKTRDRTAGASGDAVGGGSGFIDTTVLEVALSTGTARALEVGLGDRPVLVPAATRHGAVVVDIVGLFDVTDPSDPRWFSDLSLATPFREQVTMDTYIFHAVGLLAPEAHPSPRRRLHDRRGATPLPMAVPGRAGQSRVRGRGSPGRRHGKAPGGVSVSWRGQTGRRGSWTDLRGVRRPRAVPAATPHGRNGLRARVCRPVGGRRWIAWPRRGRPGSAAGSGGPAAPRAWGTAHADPGRGGDRCHRPDSGPGTARRDRRFAGHPQAAGPGRRDRGHGRRGGHGRGSACGLCHADPSGRGDIA